MTREQLLAETSRALHECHPERADAMMREIEMKFRDPAVPRASETERVELLLSASGALAWPERSGWGLAFEFVRAMQKLAEAGFKGDVRVRIDATRE